MPTVAELESQIAELTAQLKAQAPMGRAGFIIKGPAGRKSEEIKALHGEPKTYIALENGIDYKQGFIAAGQKFTTTQPQGSWMEPVEEEAKPKGKAKADAE